MQARIQTIKHPYISCGQKFINIKEIEFLRYNNFESEK